MALNCVGSKYCVSKSKGDNKFVPSGKRLYYVRKVSPFKMACDMYGMVTMKSWGKFLGLCGKCHVMAARKGDRKFWSSGK